MRTLSIQQDAAIVASTTTNGAAVDMTLNDIPFLPNYSAVAAISLEGAANGDINIQGEDTAAGTDWVTLATVNVTTASTKTVYAGIKLKQRLRVQTVGVAGGAGAVSVSLLGN